MTEYALLDELSDDQFNLKLQLHKLSLEFDTGSVSEESLTCASEVLKDAESRLRDTGFQLHALSKQGIVNPRGEVNFRDLDAIKAENETAVRTGSLNNRWTLNGNTSDATSNEPASIFVASTQNENFPPRGHPVLPVPTPPDVEMVDSQPLTVQKRSSRDVSPIRVTQPLMPFGSPGTPKIKARLRSDVNRDSDRDANRGMNHGSSRSRESSESPPPRSRQRPRSAGFAYNCRENDRRVHTEQGHVFMSPGRSSVQSEVARNNLVGNNLAESNLAGRDLTRNDLARNNLPSLNGPDNRLFNTAKKLEFVAGSPLAQPNSSTTFNDVFSTQSSDLARSLVSENRELRQKLSTRSVCNPSVAIKLDSLQKRMENLTLDEVRDELKSCIETCDDATDDTNIIAKLRIQLSQEKSASRKLQNALDEQINATRPLQSRIEELTYTNQQLQSRIEELERERSKKREDLNLNSSPHLTVEQELYFRQYDNQRLRDIREKLQSVCRYQKAELAKNKQAKMQRLQWLSGVVNHDLNRDSTARPSLQAVIVAVLFQIRTRNEVRKTRQARRLVKEVVGIDRFLFRGGDID